MRHLLLLGSLSFAGLSACKSDCGPVDSFNSFTYRAFANPVTSEIDNLAFTAAPEFWSYGSPANGTSDWQIQWGPAPVGAVTVLIDGQAFEGNGEIDEVECGSAVVNFGGVYDDSLVDVEHTFNASMALQFWTDEAGIGQLGAYLVWKSSWSHPSSQTGSFSATSHLTGQLLSQGTGS